MCAMIRVPTERILAAYLAGEKIDVICALYGVAPVTPRAIARRAGIPPRKSYKRQYCRFGGHELTGDNLYIRPGNRGRGCRACRNIATRRSKQRHRKGTSAASQGASSVSSGDHGPLVVSQ